MIAELTTLVIRHNGLRRTPFNKLNLVVNFMFVVAATDIKSDE